MNSTIYCCLALVLFGYISAMSVGETKSVRTEPRSMTAHEKEDLNYRNAKHNRRQVVLRGNGRSQVPVEKVDVISPIEKATLNLGRRVPGLMEGDIMIQQIERKMATRFSKLNQLLRPKRKVINPTYSLSGYATWPLGIIPYVVDTTTYSNAVSSTVENTVRQALNAWESQTCLKFLPADNVTAAIVNHTSSVRVYSGSGCWSYIGYLGLGYSQDISLQESGCLYAGVIMHEFGHVMGMIHEQSRPDREGYVTVLYNNIISGYEGNFYKTAYPNVNIPVPYDVNSVMHYGATDFSASSAATIAPRSLPMVSLFGQRSTATFYDAKAINSLYQCSGQCNLNCQNDGYSLQLSNGSCTCVCPYGLGGPLCSISQFSCGAVITLSADGTAYQLKSPNFPSSYNAGVKCSWLFKAPAGFIIKLAFASFNLSASTTQCYHYLDVRSNLIGQPAASVYCGFGLPDDVYSSRDSLNSSVLVIMDASLGNIAATTGFSASVSAYKDGCLGDPCRGAPCISAPGSSNYTCQLPTSNFICNFENMISANCTSVQMNDSHNSYEGNITQRTWELYRASVGSTPSVAANGNFYLGSLASYHGSSTSNGFFRIMPYNFQGSTRCVKFQYYMNSDSAGYLKVYRAVNGVLGNPVFTINGTLGDQWNKQQLLINPTASSQDLIEIIFESLHDSENVDAPLIGIDDLRYFAGSCPTGPCASDPCGTATCTATSPTTFKCAPSTGYPTSNASCNFEAWEDCSGLLNFLVTGDTLDWKPYYWRGPGTLWANPTGPMGPATGLTYLYGQLYDRTIGNKIWLRIKAFGGNRCLRFKYSMFGINEGSMSVYRSLNGAYPGSKLWSISGNQGDVWKSAAVSVNNTGVSITVNVELTVEVTKGNGYASDYGIDDVIYTSGFCS